MDTMQAAVLLIRANLVRHYAARAIGRPTCWEACYVKPLAPYYGDESDPLRPRERTPWDYYRAARVYWYIRCRWGVE